MAIATTASARVELTRLARESTSEVDGVVALSSGPNSYWATEDSEGRVDGVVCLPVSGGGFRVELHLVARMTPLVALAEKVRDRVERDAARAGLADEIVRIDIAFEDIAEPVPTFPGDAV